MKHMALLTATLTFAVLALASLATADVPQMINYQGYLTDENGDPVPDGDYLLTFRIYNVVVGGAHLWEEIHPAVPVTDGFFSVILGAGTPPVPINDAVFNQPDRWLGITIEADPELTPRTRLVTVPYAFRVSTVDGASGGTITSKVSIGPGHTNTGANAFVTGANNTATGDYSIVGGGGNNAASADYGTISGGRNNIASSIHYSTVGGGYGNEASGSGSTVGGGDYNAASRSRGTVGGGHHNTTGAFYGGVFSGYYNIAGDDEDDTAVFVGGGWENEATARFSSVSGGYRNTATNSYSSVGGGENNTASSFASTVAGGSGNTASSVNGTIGGGDNNIADGQAVTVSGGSNNQASVGGSTVGGGSNNTASSWYATVSGGASNTAGWRYAVICGGQDNSNEGEWSVIPGGESNTIALNADYSMAFGDQVFVNNAYRVVFFGGCNDGRFGLNRDDNDGGISHPIHVGTNGNNGNGAHLTAGGVWTNGSSREFKDNFETLNGKEVLDRIDELHIESWEYKGTDERHIWPCAEDFHEAFDIGVIKEDGTRDVQYLAAGDVAGVALVGVQELYRMVKDQHQMAQELQAKTQEIEELRAEMAQLQALVETILAQQRSSNSGSNELAFSK